MTLEEVYKKNNRSNKWYKTRVSVKDWNTYYSKIGYTFLEKDKNGVLIGFSATIPPRDGQEIISMEELRKIQLHMEAINAYPQPFEKVDPREKAVVFERENESPKEEDGRFEEIFGKADTE